MGRFRGDFFILFYFLSLVDLDLSPHPSILFVGNVSLGVTLISPSDDGVGPSSLRSSDPCV